MTTLSDISKSEMYDQVAGFPEQIEEALKAEVKGLKPSRKICICGMGASSLAGDILSNYVDEVSEVPIFVIRSTVLPKWVGRDTTVVVISYSGNTRETLCVYDEARSRGCKIVAITSGGSLMNKAKVNSNVVVDIPQGMQSRGALGYLIGSLAVVLDELNVCSCKKIMSALVPVLKEYRDSIVSREANDACMMAKAVVGGIPVVYCPSNMRSAAVRWKTQFNENAKMIAFFGIVPEFNHNEIIGWTEDKGHNRDFIPVMIHDDRASSFLKNVTDKSMGLLEEEEIKIPQYHAVGGSNLEINLKCIMVGDFISLYLAHMKSADAGDDQAVSEVKERMTVDESSVPKGQ
jgi:glucose/mannose-6-phosphate isomerase